MQYSSLFTVSKHLAVWFGLIVFLTISPIQYGWTISNKHSSLIPQIYGALTNAIIFYGIAFYFIPNYFNKNRKRAFWLYSIVAILGMTLLEAVVDSYLGKYVYLDTTYDVPIIEFGQDQLGVTGELSFAGYVASGFVYALLVNLLYFVVAFAYRFPIDKRINAQREAQLTKERLSSELEFLRAQVHPHTLFNGMNSIYHLIDTHPEKAKETLLYLSNSLRYHLYESQEPFVALDKEIVYLREYIELYQVRNDEEVKCSVHIEEIEEDYKIAPLLFTPFVENAFKYVSRYPEYESNTIDLHLKIIADQLIFTCINTVDEQSDLDLSTGIGLKNVKKRLNLIYNESYCLIISPNEDEFSVQLKIKLKK